MAQADDQDTPPDRIWVLLGDYIALAGEQRVRWGLDRGLPCRYRDAWGNLRPGNSLPGGYWLDCEINCKEHSAKRRERIIPRSGFDNNYFARFKTLPPEYGAGRATTPPNSVPPPTQDRVIPALEIFCVEIFVPYAEKPAVEPAPLRSELSESAEKLMDFKTWLVAAVERRKSASDIPTGFGAITKFSRQLAREMAIGAKTGKCVEARNYRTIEAKLREWDLW